MKIEQIFEFIEMGEDVMVDQVFNDCVQDALLYEDDYIVESLDKYMEMLETDKVDEEFEEHLSKVLVPYFSQSAEFYEGVIFEGKMSRAYQKNKAKVQGLFNKNEPLKTGPQPLKHKASLKGKAKFAYADAKHSAGKFLKSMRDKYGAKALSKKIGSAYQAAKTFVGDKATKLRKSLGAGIASLKNVRPMKPAAAAA